MPLTYSSYLQLDALLQCQKPLSEGPEHDELLFIVIHQSYELWFKQMLHELDYLVRLFNAGERNRALHTLKRVDAIYRTLIQQVDILETLTPLEFLSFRDRLSSASGFQSFQFRELEFLYGAKDPKKLDNYTPGCEHYRRLHQRLASPTLWDAFLRFLVHEGHQVPKSVLERDVSQVAEPSPAVQNILIDIYRNDPLVSEICEALVDIDISLQQWRYRHVKMVERTIGSKSGTGGSSGVGYLQSTLHKTVFPDLWAIRSEF
ncbi:MULTISPECIES: tryptophan 2,3-dioxygenase [unclassified Microbulbifer]|uniref:Tryptophan 2,3-dioxygenase n=1 Tax=Microbulbifer spongiae TaxID=2944933 RepID=A0ABY9EBB1_9GAMM|nr:MULTISPECIES: tryptophan 2,3-dioxygenase family protein [unclassified Microbulbifer]MDP5209427.1 tryptophan 2,3-dioxygenase family protein [Microbulbifer sp. 2205BS26-8]WKD49231.1 tryptophan 2,3-dioxygenase family protein [Microbulbifer sp. MI-G]